MSLPDVNGNCLDAFGNPDATQYIDGSGYCIQAGGRVLRRKGSRKGTRKSRQNMSYRQNVSYRRNTRQNAARRQNARRQNASRRNTRQNASRRNARQNARQNY